MILEGKKAIVSGGNAGIGRAITLAYAKEGADVVIYGRNDEKNAAVAAERKSQVGTGDRSERIRTYNFPQSRVTDHRIGLTLYKLEAFLDGDMDEVIDALILAERTRQLSSAEE